MKVLTAHQGPIDSARLFSKKFGKTLKQRLGCYQALWDPELWLFHHGPPAISAADLPSILAMSAEMPVTNGAPVGWAAFGRHVDDGMGIASSAAVIEFILSQLRLDWEITSSG